MPRVRAAAVLLFALLAACSGGGGGTEPQPAAPVITVGGVEEGATYTGAVTLTIAVDRGSYSATLDGQAVATGAVVSAPGEHLLRVDARNGTATASRTVRFTVRVAGAKVLIVRLLDLGPNEAGGGGDAILLTDSSAQAVRHALIDAGPQGANAADPGYVARRLAALGVARLDFVQLTHAHADHYAGLPAVLQAIPVGWFLYNGQARANISGYQTVLDVARQRADSVVTVAKVETPPFGLEAGGVAVIPPVAAYLANSAADSRMLNEGSLGTSLRRGTFSMFFTGDGEVEANTRWRTSFGTYSGNVSVLKVGHHGANNAVFDNGFNGASSWLAHTSPEVNVISANGRTHPRINAINALRGLPQSRTYCTNLHGEIAIRVAESGVYEVRTQRNGDQDCRPGTEANT